MRYAFIIAAMFPVCGCASIGAYFEDRAHDFADIFNLDIGVGPGLDARVRIGEFVQIGVGASYTTRFGLRGQNTGFWEETAYGIGIIDYLEIKETNVMRYPARGRDKLSGRRVSPGPCIPMCMIPLEGRCAADTNIDKMSKYDFDVSATCVIIGLRAGINISELVDFIAGLFLVDFLDDDLGYAFKPNKTEENNKTEDKSNPPSKTQTEK